MDDFSLYLSVQDVVAGVGFVVCFGVGVIAGLLS